MDPFSIPMVAVVPPGGRDAPVHAGYNVALTLTLLLLLLLRLRLRRREERESWVTDLKKEPWGAIGTEPPRAAPPTNPETPGTASLGDPRSPGTPGRK
jgi:hypothetical protein